MDRFSSMLSFVKLSNKPAASRPRHATLNLSPSLVTTHIKSLEDRLGVRLLNRAPVKLVLRMRENPTTSAACKPDIAMTTIYNCPTCEWTIRCQ